MIISCADGSQDTRSGGSRSWRNNNPGNIGAGSFARRQGSIGSAATFAVFADEFAGREAQLTLLRRADYQGMTVNGAIASWAPPEAGNPTANYQAYVLGQLGVRGDTRLNALSAPQLGVLADAMQAFEGWSEGTVTNNRRR